MDLHVADTQKAQSNSLQCSLSNYSEVLFCSVILPQFCRYRCTLGEITKLLLCLNE